MKRARTTKSNPKELQQAEKCYCCENPPERSGVFREVIRGDRKGDTVGPLCDDCERFMEQHVLIEATAR